MLHRILSAIHALTYHSTSLASSRTITPETCVYLSLSPSYKLVETTLLDKGQYRKRMDTIVSEREGEEGRERVDYRATKILYISLFLALDQLTFCYSITLASLRSRLFRGFLGLTVYKCSTRIRSSALLSLPLSLSRE